MNLPEIKAPTPNASPTDKRAVFFALSSLVCLVLVPVCPADYQWIGWTLVVAYAVLAVLSFLDHWGRRHSA